MGMSMRLYNILLISLLFLSYPAFAAVPMIAVNFNGHYDLSFAGIPFGRMDIEAEEDASHYRMEADIASVGLVDVFAQHSSQTRATATGKDFKFTERSYKTHTQTRKKKRDISMDYKNGRYVNEVVVPPDNRESRAEVPADLKKDAFDPLSIVLELRRIVMQKMATGDNSPFSIKLYDGRRLTRADATLPGSKTIRVNGAPVAVVHLSLKRTPLAGFTDKELSQYQNSEPALDVYFSDDEIFLPVKLSLPFTFGSLEATLAK